MPTIKFKHVCSASSEDPNHPANNLLSPDTYRKWLCSSTGEKQGVVVLELEKSSQIHSIDIGNCGSAFIEVLVGKSSSSDDYKVLLVASSFMSPADSRSWTNTSRVRMFGKEKLSKGVVDQNWDRIKVVCTQPFNKNEKYGLSFITLHSPSDNNSKGSADTSSLTSPTLSEVGSKRLGVFALKEDTPGLPSGSLFYKKGKEKGSPPVTPPTSSSGSLAVEARKASIEALKAAESTQKKKTTNRKHSAPRHPGPSDSPPVKRMKSDSKEVPLIDFSEILKGVVFALSGFQNPLRGELRSKALEMGAEYKPDWGRSCTHLVCAFENTPKFKQVKAKNGIVVRKEWILNSYKSKTRLPASQHRFSSGTDSDEEAERYDGKEHELFKNVTYSKKEDAANDAEAGKDTGILKTIPTPVEVDKDDPYGGSTDEESNMETEIPGNLHHHGDSEECDTEDEIERIKQKDSRAEEVLDSESVTLSDNKKTSPSLLDLPDFFSKCSFLLYGNFDPAELKTIRRYIIAYKGNCRHFVKSLLLHVSELMVGMTRKDLHKPDTRPHSCIEEYMNDKVTHVVSLESWDENFDQALSDNSSLIFVKPSWIFTCHSRQSLVSYQPYSITPS